MVNFMMYSLAYRYGHLVVLILCLACGRPRGRYGHDVTPSLCQGAPRSGSTGLSERDLAPTILQPNYAPSALLRRVHDIFVGRPRVDRVRLQNAGVCVQIRRLSALIGKGKWRLTREVEADFCLRAGAQRLDKVRAALDDCTR